MREGGKEGGKEGGREGGRDEGEGRATWEEKRPSALTPHPGQHCHSPQ